MKSSTLFAAAAAFATAIAAPALADFPEKQAYLGLTGGVTFPLKSWNLGPDSVEDSFEPKSTPQAGLRVGYQLSSQFAVEAGMQALWIRLPDAKRDPGLVYNGDLLYHFEKGNFSPFVVDGAGAYTNFGEDLGDDTDFQFHVGLGVRGMATDWLALRLEVRDVFTDGFGDSHVIAGNNLEVTAGIDLFPAMMSEKDGDKDGFADERDRCPGQAGVASAQGCPDQDGDSVADGVDACAGEAGKAELKGCPDKDADGIADPEDSCPAEPGTAATKGCPDQDGDGLADAEDRCPAEAGKAELKGCADQDGDTLADRDDLCPTEAGKPETKGCPDQDGDGLADKDDLCPAAPGKAGTKGCPDQDGDGVADADDKCPAVRGLVENQGCLPKEAEKFTGSIQGISFASGKATLLPSSFKVLDQATAVLQKYPSMRILIEGHTDNVGDPAFNKRLSAERAESVRAYLEGKGIETSRLMAEGYGAERPVADNKTAAGRAKNRRVEFNLIPQ